MRTESLVGTSVNFGSWSVDIGPQIWDNIDVWKDISDRLAKMKSQGLRLTILLGCDLDHIAAS